MSLGYLSEVERGQKEASSELLASICDALDVPMSQVLREVSDELARVELARADGSRPTARAGAQLGGRRTSRAGGRGRRVASVRVGL